MIDLTILSALQERNICIQQRTTNSRRPVRQVSDIDIASISSNDIRDETSGYEVPFPQKLSGKRQNNVSYVSVAGSK